MGLVVPATDLDVDIYQGATWLENFQWLYGATEAEAVEVDLTVATAFAALREEYDSASPLALASSAEGTITMDSSGNIEIRFPEVLVGEDVTQKQKLYRQLEIHWPDGDICRLVQGRATVYLEVVLEADEA
jgi:hypothetical protein